MINKIINGISRRNSAGYTKATSVQLREGCAHYGTCSLQGYLAHKKQRPPLGPT